MLYVKNLPTWERVLRVAGGVVVAAAGVALWPGPVGWAVAAAAAGGVVSGLVGWCPMCAIVGRKLGP